VTPLRRDAVTPFVAMHESGRAGALAVRRIPVYSIELVGKTDSKPESHRFYQY